MLRHNPYPRSHIFTPSTRSSDHVRVVRSRKKRHRLSAAYIKDAFELIRPSSPVPSALREEVSMPKVRRALKSLNDGMSKVETDYAEVRELLQQQKACLQSLESTFEQLQHRSCSFDEELLEAGAHLLKLDKQIASIRDIKLQRSDSMKENLGSNRWKGSLRSLRRVSDPSS